MTVLLIFLNFSAYGIMSLKMAARIEYNEAIFGQIIYYGLEFEIILGSLNRLRKSLLPINTKKIYQARCISKEEEPLLPQFTKHFEQ